MPEALPSRFDPRNESGFYESYFQRGNHPTRPLAFWIRYTVFAPRARPEAARGELWAIYFDGERSRITAVKQDHPIERCAFSRACLDVRVSDSTLREGLLEGEARSAAHAVSWALRYDGELQPLLLLPAALYEGGFPKAKSLVAVPHARYRGTLDVDGERIQIEDWPGSQNHNWGARHTDRYLWGQVSGFDDDEQAFLECASARVRLGPWLSPTFGVIVLRTGDGELRANQLLTALRARSTCAGFDWRMSSASDEDRSVRLDLRIHARPETFVGLRYDNPTGAQKICLNSKLATAELRVERPGHAPRHFRSAHRAAFELLSDAGDPRVALAI